MKKIVLPFLLCITAAISAQKMSCCSGPSADMRTLANDPEFVS
jgi:hypothetical protein